MSIKTEISLNKEINKIVDVACTACKRGTKHKIISSVDMDGNQDDRFFWTESWQVVQCQGCETLSFREINSDSEDYEMEPDGWRHNERINIYPSRSAGRSSLEEAYFLPTNVLGIYEETVKAMNNRQPILSGIGIRALLEAISKDKNAQGKDLYHKIEDLVKIGVLTVDEARILHKIRTLGNDAVHEVKPHTNEQLGLALDVVEHLLKGVYVFSMLYKNDDEPAVF